MRDTTHWARLLAYVTGLVSQELLLQNEYLAALPPKGDALALQHTLPLIESGCECRCRNSVSGFATQSPA
jgi:hypothetical protein